MSNPFALSVNHRPVVDQESSLKFFKLLNELLSGLQFIYPQCPHVKDYTTKLVTYQGKIPDHLLAEVAASKWNHEFEKVTACGKTGYELCDSGYFRELLGAGVKPLVELRMLDKWYDEKSTDEETKTNLIEFITQLNHFCRLSLGIALPKLNVKREVAANQQTVRTVQPVQISRSKYDPANPVKHLVPAMMAAFPTCVDAKTSVGSSCSSCSSSSVISSYNPPARGGSVPESERMESESDHKQNTSRSGSGNGSDMTMPNIRELLPPAMIQNCPSHILDKVAEISQKAIMSSNSPEEMLRNFNPFQAMEQLQASLTEEDQAILSRNADRMIADPGVQQLIANPIVQSQMGATTAAANPMAQMFQTNPMAQMAQMAQMFQVNQQGPQDFQGFQGPQGPQGTGFQTR